MGSLDKLKVDEDARGRVEEYVKERVQKSKDERGGDESESEGEGGKSVKDETEVSLSICPCVAGLCAHLSLCYRPLLPNLPKMVTKRQIPPPPTPSLTLPNPIQATLRTKQTQTCKDNR